MGRPPERRPRLGGTCETHLPTKCAASVPVSWIPTSDDDQEWTGDRQRSPPSWTQEALGLIQRFRGRSEFKRLQDNGVRADRGLLWVRYLPDPSLDAAHVAYSLPRRMGPAVTRNKVRRRLREIIRCLDAQAEGGLPAGLYLIGARRGSHRLSYAGLKKLLRGCLLRFDGITL